MHSRPRPRRPRASRRPRSRPSPCRRAGASNERIAALRSIIAIIPGVERTETPDGAADVGEQPVLDRERRRSARFPAQRSSVAGSWRQLSRHAVRPPPPQRRRGSPARSSPSATSASGAPALTFVASSKPGLLDDPVGHQERRAARGDRGQRARGQRRLEPAPPARRKAGATASTIAASSAEQDQRSIAPSACQAFFSSPSRDEAGVLVAPRGRSRRPRALRVPRAARCGAPRRPAVLYQSIAITSSSASAATSAMASARSRRSKVTARQRLDLGRGVDRTPVAVGWPGPTGARRASRPAAGENRQRPPGRARRPASRRPVSGRRAVGQDQRRGPDQRIATSAAERDQRRRRRRQPAAAASP